MGRRDDRCLTVSNLHSKCVDIMQKKKKKLVCLWYTPVIPADWEAEAGGLQPQQLSEALNNLVRPCLTKMFI
uniref:Uncharacterized protein n=1 Tax=Sciurus vulgaris TaxID=55149 RepID=A0A8D2AVV8_SCIVU